MAPKHKSSNADNSDMLKKSHNMLLLGENVEVLDLIRKFKELYAKIIKIYRNN